MFGMKRGESKSSIEHSESTIYSAKLVDITPLADKSNGAITFVVTAVVRYEEKFKTVIDKFDEADLEEVLSLFDDDTHSGCKISAAAYNPEIWGIDSIDMTFEEYRNMMKRI